MSVMSTEPSKPDEAPLPRLNTLILGAIAVVLVIIAVEVAPKPEPKGDPVAAATATLNELHARANVQ